VNRRWFAPAGAVAVALVAAACGSASAGSPSNPGSTGSARPAAVSSPNSGTSTKPAAVSSPVDTALAVNVECLLTSGQAATLAPSVPDVTNVTYSAQQGCNYGSGSGANTTEQFVSVQIVTNAQWVKAGSLFQVATSPKSVSSLTGFANGQVGFMKFTSMTPTEYTTQAAAQIQSTHQWLIVVAGNTDAYPATEAAITVALTQAETQYLHPNPGTSQAESGGGGSRPFPCSLLTASEFNSFGPNGMTGSISGSGAAPNFDASTTVQTCGFVFYTGPNESGTETGYVALTLSCGPSSKLATDADDMQRVFAMPNGTPAAVGLTFGIGDAHYKNTPQALEALSAATNAAMAGGKCT
jgi:hypothetical protein